MNIPQKAIEKAIEGGWHEEKFSGYFVDESQKPQFGDGAVIVQKDILGFPGYELNYHDIALDPTFWQALGKALGWKEIYTGKCGECGHVRYQDKPYHSYDCSKNEDFNPSQPPLEYALRFYDLILTGGDTEKFWEEILK